MYCKLWILNPHCSINLLHPFSFCKLFFAMHSHGLDSCLLSNCYLVNGYMWFYCLKECLYFHIGHSSLFGNSQTALWNTLFWLVSCSIQHGSNHILIIIFASHNAGVISLVLYTNMCKTVHYYNPFLACKHKV